MIIVLFQLDLLWHQRDGLMTWFELVQCQEFLQNTDSHFQNLQILNFDIINLNEKIDVDKLKQYQTIDHHEIMTYPPEIREQIMSSIFCAKRPGMYVKKKQFWNILRNRLKMLEEDVLLRR